MQCIGGANAAPYQTTTRVLCIPQYLPHTLNTAGFPHSDQTLPRLVSSQ